MRIIADLHLHSKYSRATSGQMVVPEIAKWANYKGIDIIGTGDFTHPLWFSQLKRDLEPMGNGFYVASGTKSPRFVLSAEISSIYSQGGQVRKIHTVLLSSSLEAVEKINKKLGTIGNLHSDGRPILGLPAKDLAKIVLDIDQDALIIPAHMWTPWFSIFGSKSGFNSLEECYGEMTPNIFAGETGLSSDPEMNWRLSKLDNLTLVSNSDAHSLPNLGREANVFEVENNNYDYNYFAQIIRAKDPKYFPYTIEFYPEEGKYHLDGHRECGGLKLMPAQSIKINNICPVCKKPLTIGVLHRVEELADRPENYQSSDFPGSRHLVPLQEIIAEARGVAKTSAKIQEEYLSIVQNVGKEFEILLDISEGKLLKSIDSKIVQGIMNVRGNKVRPIGGYDGVFGVIKTLDNVEKKSSNVSKVSIKKQSALF